MPIFRILRVPSNISEGLPLPKCTAGAPVIGVVPYRGARITPKSHCTPPGARGTSVSVSSHDVYRQVHALAYPLHCRIYSRACERVKQNFFPWPGFFLGWQGSWGIGPRSARPAGEPVRCSTEDAPTRQKSLRRKCAQEHCNRESLSRLGYEITLVKTLVMRAKVELRGSGNTLIWPCFRRIPEVLAEPLTSPDDLSPRSTAGNFACAALSIRMFRS